MAPGPALGARHPPDPVETNIDPVSLFGGWPTPAISSGPCGAPLARHLSRRRGAEPREQGACRADRLLHRDVRRPGNHVREPTPLRIFLEARPKQKRDVGPNVNRAPPLE